MISTRRFGRLGNELYQYAHVIAYARKHGLEYSIPNTTDNYIWNPVHFSHLCKDSWVKGKEDVVLHEEWNTDQQYYELPFREEWRNSQIVLNGYWQSWKFFDFCRDEVLSVFNFPYTRKNGYVSCHIRRGDYLLHPTKHPVVTEEYLLDAINLMKRKVGDDFVLKFFSDDIAWCKYFAEKHFRGNDKIEFSIGQNEMQDLISMSECEHNICSNSTMALWAAELNLNPDKIVIVPSESNWFGPDNSSKLTVKDLFRPEWLQIKY